MDQALQRRVQRYGWDRASESYEAFWAAQLRPAQRLLLERARLSPGDHVVDVACGTGLVTREAAREVGPSGRVVGTDLSQKMVDRLLAVAAADGLTNIDARRMDAESLDFPDGTFDAALCALGLMYVPDVPRALAELRRVVRPGGRLVAAVWGARKHCGWAEIFPIVESRVQSDVCPLFFALGTGDELARQFERAGFADVRTDRITTILEYASAHEAIGAAFIGGPVAMAYSRFDEPTKAAAHEEYLQSIEAYRTDGHYHLPGEFVVVSGRRGGGIS
jgi:ubiquinone/menaquinone biosynthesis C-methylase UbiE